MNLSIPCSILYAKVHCIYMCAYNVLQVSICNCVCMCACICTITHNMY